MSVNVPKVFISYSHDTQAHKKWVLELAQRLRNAGVDAILDQFRVGLGDDLGGFMETSVAESDRIIMVCTDNYVSKANSGLGGVGYEKMIMTAEYMTNIDSNKVIPLIRQNGTHNTPTFVQTRAHINFSREDEYELQFDNLLREIHQAPLFKEPPVGNNPFESVVEKPAESVSDKKMELLKEMIKIYNQGTDYLYFEDLARMLGCSKIFSEIYISDLKENGFIQSTFRNVMGSIVQVYSVTDKAKLNAIEQGWITE
ncbi:MULTISPECIES: toll/interleukin-1 receptor domain-containing protein [unclassified Pseudoalteromonas]|uniref:toll/interleukin-1 receptor domain-containing protein n=1 Tax=unclassified Pseudoalteromonas TaxID=194690 RepID=UPI00390C7A80|nr:toll/interleukin-1 receptor domain-containing protein [Ningiella sp. W23]